MKRMRAEQIRQAMKRVPAWERKRGVISRTFSFADFRVALRFVNRVGRMAEEEQHHPDIDIRWNRVTLAWTTHDTGGLTRKDFALARRCDGWAG